MRVYHGTLTSSIRTLYRLMYPRFPPSCTSSWRQSFCSGWKYSVSSALSGSPSKRCRSSRTGWRCVEFLLFVFYPRLLILDPGITNARLGQRLFPFRNRVLRDHQRILSAYLSLGARVGPREFNRTKTVRVIHPPFHSNHPWKTDAVGCGHCDHNTSR